MVARGGHTGLSLRGWNIDPSFLSRGLLHCVEDLLITQPVVEVGRYRLIRGDGCEQVSNLVDEGMFPTDDVSRRPPFADLGMV